MEVLRPGSWVDFQGVRAFVVAAIIEDGQVAYRLFWMGENNQVLESTVPAGMLEDEKGERVRIGFMSQEVRREC